MSPLLGGIDANYVHDSISLKSVLCCESINYFANSFKDDEMKCSLLKLCPPSDEQISSMTDFLEPIFQRQSACHNKNIETRDNMAVELERYVQMEFPGTVINMWAADIHREAHRYI